MLKSFFNWKVWLNLVVAIGLLFGLVWGTFRWLEHYANHGQEVEVPNILNLNIQEAVKQLDDYGLNYQVDSLTFNPKYKPLQVLKVWPSAGSKVKYGRDIKILINPKTCSKVTVPAVVNKYMSLAFRQLEQVGLKIGDTIYEPNIQKDAVIRIQMDGRELKPGTQVPRFSIVSLVVGTGPKRNIPVPNIVGLTVEQAERIIQQNLFEVGLNESEDGNRDKSDIVYFQDPEAGSLRDQGNQVNIWSSKKVPAEMIDKIEELSSVYRMKIDPSLDNVGFDDGTTSSLEVPQPKKVEPSSEPNVPTTSVATPPKSEPKKKEVSPEKLSTTKSQPSDKGKAPADNKKVAKENVKKKEEKSKSDKKATKKKEKRKTKKVVIE